MPVDRLSDTELAAVATLIEGWAADEKASNPLVAAVDRDPELDRWYVRMRGEEKSVITLWLTLGQRTLQYESYFMPAPIERRADCFEYLLRANRVLFGMRFAVGAEDAVYLVGQMPLGAVDRAELDRITGAVYAASERYFRPAMAIGYGAAFRG
ncbi:MAG TPA: YbjN domain-containing protein [Acidimicrobiales bacterium]|nr:YbjN domain-containing protein [Acidimicrobiales bacterium]